MKSSINKSLFTNIAILLLCLSPASSQAGEDAAFDGDVHAVVPYDASFANVPPLFGP